ncbi:hypothetical protein BH20BAC1_BH20BAC1_26420 [soil metagenome]
MSTALLFGLSSITTVFVIRKWILPVIPENLFRIGAIDFTRSMITMILFAVLMLVASIGMIRDYEGKRYDGNLQRKINFPALTMYGVAIGIAKGLLGAGGGFLLIPALVLIVGLPMKKAIGTSLLIIALNSLIGFTGDIGHFVIDWIFLLKITAIAIAGIFIGGAIEKKIKGDHLKKGLGWFVLVMGFYIIFHELIQ